MTFQEIFKRPCWALASSFSVTLTHKRPSCIWLALYSVHKRPAQLLSTAKSIGVAQAGTPPKPVPTICSTLETNVSISEAQPWRFSHVHQFDQTHHHRHSITLLVPTTGINSRHRYSHHNRDSLWKSLYAGDDIAYFTRRTSFSSSRCTDTIYTMPPVPLARLRFYMHQPFAPSFLHFIIFVVFRVNLALAAKGRQWRQCGYYVKTETRETGLG